MTSYRPLLALLLLSSVSTTRAESAPAAAPAAPHARVETVFEGATQALLFDQDRGEYVVVRPGDSFQGLSVTSVKKDQVVLSSGDQHFVLVLPSSPAPAVAKAAPRVTTAAVPTLPDEPIDPYGHPPGPSPSLAPEPGPKTPVDPYAPDPGAGPPPTSIPTSTPPSPTTTPSLPSLDPLVPPTHGNPNPAANLDPSPAVNLDPSPTPPADPETSSPAVKDEHITVSRAELDAALADFTALSREIQLAREGQRIRIRQIATGSFPHRLGLRAGDLLVSVADKAVSDLDAAAEAYAVVRRADQFEIKLYRGDNRMKIHVRLKR